MLVANRQLDGTRRDGPTATEDPPVGADELDAAIVLRTVAVEPNASAGLDLETRNLAG